MKKRILTVDDSRVMREMLKVSLTEAGYEVIQAEDGIEGVEVAKESVPDAIVTDINMPRMDGFGLIEEVRDVQELKSVPILVLTTEDGAEKKERARKAGATGWIKKPFDDHKLKTALQRVVA